MSDAFTPPLRPARSRALPRVIAHRGARLEAPENTLPAFRRALELGAEGVEFDVQLTSDNVPVVIHDDELGRITGVRAHLHRTPFEMVRSLDAAHHFPDKAFAGTRIPTLTEALELLAPHDILTNIEIKHQKRREADAVDAVGQALRAVRMRGPVIISSMNVRVVHELGRRHPDIPRALIIRSPFLFFTVSPIALFARYEKLAALHPFIGVIGQKNTVRMQRAGYAVNVWTVNHPREIDACLALGVDGVVTDDVAFVKRYLRDLSGPREEHA
jgi:glycerophosphoryl diester phosphodiesterase